MFGRTSVVTFPTSSSCSQSTPQASRQKIRYAEAPGAAGYRIFWREAWGPDWQQDVRVGNVTSVILPNMQIDDYVFGVAAIDAGGHESFVTAYVTPPRVSTEIKTKSGT